MASNFLIADLISRLNVAMRSHSTHTVVRFSKLTWEILDLFYDFGLISSYSVVDSQVIVRLRYNEGMPAFHSLKLVSKPSKRVYWTLSRLDLVHRCHSFGGFFVISTNSGILTSYDCLSSNKVSGEVLLEVIL